MGLLSLPPTGPLLKMFCLWQISSPAMAGDPLRSPLLILPLSQLLEQLLQLFPLVESLDWTAPTYRC